MTVVTNRKGVGLKNNIEYLNSQHGLVKMKRRAYGTGVEEVRKALSLADEKNKMVIEDKSKIAVICILSKAQVKKLDKDRFLT